MAWGEFTFSREGRLRLAAVLRALLIVQLVVSIFMALFCYNTSIKVLVLLKHVHKVTVYLLYMLILLQAYCLKLHYTSGLRLMSWFIRGPYWPRAMFSSMIWMTTGTCVAINGILVYVAVKATLQALMKELNSSLRIGISVYLVEPQWKRILDTMQIELGCCGADTPKDWHEIPWINMNFLNEKSSVAMKLAGADGKVLPPVSPYSCCTPRVLAACYHDPLQQTEWRDVWSDGAPLVMASLHARGCIEAVRAPLAKAGLAMQILSMLVLLIQVVIVVVSQLIRSSATDAVLRGDCDGDGCASLLPRAAPAQRSCRELPVPRGPRPPPPPPPTSGGSGGGGSGRGGVAAGGARAAWRMQRSRRRRRRPSEPDRTLSYPYLS